jgi:hypothetical protein
MTAGHERPREEWIEIPVPALVSEDSFARAQELPRAEQDTIAPSHHRAEHRTGAGQLSEVRLRPSPHIDAHLRTQDPLLQMYWLGWLAQTGVALHSNGSSSICGLLTVNKRKESSAQQFSSGTTIHLALQSFEPIDLPLGLSVTPALRNGIPDSCKVIANGVGESTESVQARSVSIVQP